MLTAVSGLTNGTAMLTFLKTCKLNKKKCGSHSFISFIF